MNKVLTVILASAALLLAGWDASAQFSIGAGPATRLYYNGEDPVTNIVGVLVGFEDSNRSSDYFGFSAGLDFSVFKKRDFYSAEEGLSEMYLEMPVRMKFYIPMNSVDLFFFGGPVPSLCINSKLIKASGSENRFKDPSNYSRFDVLAGGGIGLEIAQHLKLALGYDHGLFDRDKTEEGKLKTGMAKFTVGYMF